MGVSGLCSDDTRRRLRRVRRSIKQAACLSDARKSAYSDSPFPLNVNGPPVYVGTSVADFHGASGITRPAVGQRSQASLKRSPRGAGQD